MKHVVKEFKRQHNGDNLLTYLVQSSSIDISTNGRLTEYCTNKHVLYPFCCITTTAV